MIFQPFHGNKALRYWTAPKLFSSPRKLPGENTTGRVRSSKIASEFMGHSVETVRSMGWRGIKNGELLQRVVDSGFEVFIMVDKNLEYQQKLSVLPLSIIVLDRFVIPSRSFVH